MNEENMLLLSTVLELLFLFSVVFALLVWWMNSRAKRSAKAKHGSAPVTQPRRALDGSSRE